MNILNCYAGIGGNRKLWGNIHEITAVEYDERIASIYSDLFPNDTVIVGDAHQYLLDHYTEFDFIWCSPPCPTHSITNHFLNAQGHVRYPDMVLYQEIILLKHFFKGKYCVENVKSYYDPLIQPQISGRHYFWSNIQIPHVKGIKKQIGRMNGSKKTLGQTQGKIRHNNHLELGFDLSKYIFPDKEKLMNNCVDPLIGKAILDKVLEIEEYNSIKQGELFS